MFHRLNKIVCSIIVVLALLATGARAQEEGYGRVLVPVWVERPTAGANGSIWTTTLSVVYHGDDPETLLWGFDAICAYGFCPFTPAGLTFMPTFDWVAWGVHGVPPARYVVGLPEHLPDVSFALRVAEQSRLANTWGFTIPVVPETAAFTGAINLLDMPVEGDFRTMLRVYDFDAELHFREPAVVRVRLYAHDPEIKMPRPGTDQLLFDREFSFRYAPEGLESYTPGYLEVPNVEKLATLPAGKRLRIEVTPVTAGLRFWAFASVTHNETQQITVALP